jgi:hypothetical protein
MVVYLNNAVPCSSENPMQVLLLDETDQGFYVLLPPTGKAFFVPRSNVSSVFFGTKEEAAVVFCICFAFGDYQCNRVSLPVPAHSRKKLAFLFTALQRRQLVCQRRAALSSLSESLTRLVHWLKY